MPREYFHVPVMMKEDEVDWLKRQVRPMEDHRKSRSALIRHLIHQAKKNKDLLKPIG